jgi:hypothetical protein
LGEAIHDKAMREKQILSKSLLQKLVELKAIGMELEKTQKEMETRQVALEDRKAKLAKKQKPELEEQVRGAELLLNEAIEKVKLLSISYAQQEVLSS